MAQTNDNDDLDLLILSDENTNNDTLILEENDSISDNSPSDGLISFENIPSEKNDGNGFDFSNFDSENKPIGDINKLTDEKLEVEKNTLDNDLSNNLNVTDNNQVLEIENDSTTSSFAGNNNIGTMIDILNRAISESTLRADMIESEIETEQKNISELKEKISILVGKVKVSENIVSELNYEKTMIIKNTKSLEKMKIIDRSAIIAK